MSVGSVLTVRSIVLVLTHFARIDRFVRTKRNAVDFHSLDGLDGPDLAIAAVTLYLSRRMPGPHSLASLAHRRAL